MLRMKCSNRSQARGFQLGYDYLTRQDQCCIYTKGVFIMENWNKYQELACAVVAKSFCYYRELLWHSFMDIAKEISPLIDWKKFGSLFQQGAKHSSGNKVTNNESCGICHKSPITNAVIAGNCRHVFCYYCLSTAFNGSDVLACPGCRGELRFNEIDLVWQSS